MLNTGIDTDLLIVGGGPVGLFLANECARRGLRCRLIEARSSQSEYSKALTIYPRTLEIFDMAGIVGPFLEMANRVTAIAVVAHGRMLAHTRFDPKGTPYPFIAMVPQNVTEQLLLQELRRKGEVIGYETAFVSADQHDDWVDVTVEQKGEPIKIRASFVAGCDGVRSKVRESMNLRLEGAEYRAAFLLAEIETNGLLPANQMMFCPSEFGPVAIFPLNASRRRIVATIEHAEGDAPSLDLVRKILAQRAARAKRDRGTRTSLEQLFSGPSPPCAAVTSGTYVHRRGRSSHSQPIWRAGHEHWIA